VAEAFFQRVLKQARPYLSDEHFTVDGTLLEARAKRVFGGKTKKKPLGADDRDVDFHREQRRNEQNGQKLRRQHRYPPLQKTQGEGTLGGIGDRRFHFSTMEIGDTATKSLPRFLHSFLSPVFPIHISE